MDTPPPLPTGSSPSHRRLLFVVALVALLVLAEFAWIFFVRGPSASQTPQKNAGTETPLGQVVATTSVSVPATANPIPQATPAVNPVEKTNPFTNEYHNPFQ